MTAVMTLSSFRVSPRKGHLQRVKRIYGYLAKFKDSAIRIRTDIPDYSNIECPQYEWEESVYGETKEILPDVLEYSQLTSILSLLRRTLI